MLFDANSAIFQLYHDENKLIFNEMMRISGGKQRQMNKKNDFEFQMC
jgi:hypothetical protein